MNRNSYKLFDYKQISFLGSFSHLSICKISSQLRVTTKTLKITAFHTHTSQMMFVTMTVKTFRFFFFLLATARITCPMRIRGEEYKNFCCLQSGTLCFHNHKKYIKSFITHKKIYIFLLSSVFNIFYIYCIKCLSPNTFRGNFVAIKPRLA